MSRFSIPKWVHQHSFHVNNLDSVPANLFEQLKHRLTKFNVEDPEVSIVIPAYNEEKNLLQTLSSLSEIKTKYKTELIVVNNNSTDRTQEVLDSLGVKSCFQPLQGIAYARKMGLEMAAGKYHLCADADTLYPPDWVELMVKPMIENREIVGVYGRYSILPPQGHGRFGLWIYELMTGILFRLRKNQREFINVLGFNMGFITEIGRDKKGFDVKEVRKFNNSKNSKEFTEMSEDGVMAIQLMTVGKLKMVTDPRARVYTSSRKLLDDGSIAKAFINRLKKHSRNLLKYALVKKANNNDAPVKV